MELQLENEPELLVRIAAGDEQAFAVIFQHYYHRLLPFISKYTDNEMEVEEIVQDTFIRVWVNRDKLPDIQYFRAWLFKVASREFLLFLRKKMANARLMTQAAKDIAHIVPVSTPQDDVQLLELKRLIHVAILEQPKQRRRIYQMSRDGGMKIAEIAAALAISPNTVKNSLTTTLKEVRAQIARNGYVISVAYLIILLGKK
ncbi:RNA polymerase sigma-70 factor, ECF subfamily [Chitinophaga costaii]|uniref:RNA polymerase sigma factor n=2 Tax=Chitinophaga costaii TaxID=1335309 RepID=A0A1C4BJS9_9BACT|nr:hypothetical protein DCM91_04985 [Chitinophaga costaii]SCC07115.1 RNA polymerase sigma-70 factor, ECF subfamily [Chitinophaga costaii]